jgi:pimeloyl-ACP methyl ester carboxylesterase
MAVLALAGCGGAHPHAQRARLTGARPCDGIPGFTCATLTVPLDHAGQAPGSLQLSVGVQRVRSAPRGVLLFLTGGPGQPGLGLLPTVDSRLRAALAGYRLVMFDQRGTGARALRCPALQDAAGSSDLAIVEAGTIAACARKIGPSRQYYSTPETVADIDQLRAALGVQKLTIDGVSYGTFVAERYALTYPAHVARLVLDSVVPHAGVDPLYLAALQASARVLRAACAAQQCHSDPAQDLAAVVRADHNGPQILGALVAASVADPRYPGVPDALRSAKQGQPAGLNAFINVVDREEAAPAQALSQGLHESTLCLDLLPPWDARTPSAVRAAALATEAADQPASAFFPFDRATAIANGLARGCLAWPPTTAPDLGAVNRDAPLPPVPVLLIAGGHDLSTPLEWARQEAAKAPDGRLVVVPTSGHSVQLRSENGAVRRILARFLATPTQ